MRVLPWIVVLLLLPVFSATAQEEAEPAVLLPVKIGILDTGIETTHSQFQAGQVVAWRDYINRIATPYDDHGHGTAVASRAAGSTLGGAPGAQLIIGKVLRSDNLLNSWADVSNGIRWAVDQGAQVVSISIWGTGPQPTNSLSLANAIDYAHQHAVLVVWIAGNGGTVPFVCSFGVPGPVTSTVLVGSSSPQALVVGASNPDGSPACFSQGDPELIAWGANVPIAALGGGITTGSGTSFAAPWVAGAAARLLADGAPQDPDWLEWVLLHQATDRATIPYVKEGYGLLGPTQLDAARAVARGEAPVPGPDARDVEHALWTVPRVAQTAKVPSGVLPPQ
jgi:serine protease AprX